MLWSRRREALARAAGVMALGLSGASGCLFGDLDHTGQACPCPDGWWCNYDVCERGPGCAVWADDARIAWTTPHTIRWEWEPRGDLARFGSYRVQVGVGTGPDDIQDAREITATENPELGFATIPRLTATDIVRSTITYGHLPSTSYVGRLEMVDDTGCVWSSGYRPRSTELEPPQDQTGLVIFDDQENGWILPPELASVVDDPAGSFAGTSHVLFLPPETDGENVQLGGLGFPFDAVGAALADTAYVEFAVALASDNHSFFSRIALQAAPESTGRHARLEGFTVPADATYHVVEIPIHALSVDDAAPPFDPATDALQKFMFGCSPFEAGSEVRLDEIRIRW